MKLLALRVPAEASGKLFDALLSHFMPTRRRLKPSSWGSLGGLRGPPEGQLKPSQPLLCHHDAISSHFSFLVLAGHTMFAVLFPFFHARPELVSGLLETSWGPLGSSRGLPEGHEPYYAILMSL